MGDDSAYDVLIVSDLHMSSGYHRLTQTYNRLEDFFYDDEFGRFLDHFGRCKDRRWRLLILGDLIDFMQVPIRLDNGESAFWATDERSAVEKLVLVKKGHPGMFE